MSTHPAYEDCQTCYEYGKRRMGAVVPAMRERRQQTGETGQQVLDRYMAGVHERHLSGLSLEATP